MLRAADLTIQLADLPGWIAQQALETDDGEAVIADLGRSLVAAGVPIRLLGFGTPSLSAAHRGVFMSWRPGATVEHFFAPHGEVDHDRSPIEAALDSERYYVRWDLARDPECATLPQLVRLRDEGCTEYLLDIVGFPPGTDLRGVGLFYATDRPGGFSEADVAILRSLREALSLAILRFALSHALENLLEAYVGPRTAPLILNGRVRRGEGELISAAILLADLKGFTALTDRADPHRLVGWLDEHLDALGRDVGRHGGEIFKFTGDGFIAAFPAEDAATAPCAACTAALAAARAGLAHNRALEARRRDAGAPWLAADLALHYGQVVYGNIGTADRLDFTAIGRAVNEASRIETLCDPTGRNLLMSDSFARRCVGSLVDLGTFPLRGVALPQRVWTVAEA
jgi:adenylate cyclase